MPLCLFGLWGICWDVEQKGTSSTMGLGYSARALPVTSAMNSVFACVGGPFLFFCGSARLSSALSQTVRKTNNKMRIYTLCADGGRVSLQGKDTSLHGGAWLLSLLHIVFFFGGGGGCNSVLWSALSITISCYVATTSSSNFQDVPDTL